MDGQTQKIVDKAKLFIDNPEEIANYISNLATQSGASRIMAGADQRVVKYLKLLQATPATESKINIQHANDLETVRAGTTLGSYPSPSPPTTPLLGNHSTIFSQSTTPSSMSNGLPPSPT
jgi:hypothetical protein